MIHTHPFRARAVLALARVFVPALLASLLAFAAPAAVAANNAKKSFDIPAGQASATLKQFTTQAGEQLLYSMDTVKGIASNAIKGQMSAREALNQMFSGTSLKVVEDRSNGALSL